jgi:integrase
VRISDLPQIRAASDESGITARFGWHALPHFAITSWNVSGRYDLKDVQHMAGHATLAMTLDVYGHFVLNRDAHARASEHAGALLGR